MNDSDGRWIAIALLADSQSKYYPDGKAFCPNLLQSPLSFYVSRILHIYVEKLHFLDNTMTITS